VTAPSGRRVAVVALRSRRPRTVRPEDRLRRLALRISLQAALILALAAVVRLFCSWPRWDGPAAAAVAFLSLGVWLTANGASCSPCRAALPLARLRSLRRALTLSAGVAAALSLAALIP